MGTRLGRSRWDMWRRLIDLGVDQGGGHEVGMKEVAEAVMEVVADLMLVELVATSEWRWH